MNYAENRDYEQMLAFDGAITTFINQYAIPPANPAHPRHTVFFFPGGMASQLMRATMPFLDGISYPQEFDYDTVWLAYDTFTGGALNLQMYRDVNGVFRDKDDRIIVAQGLVEQAEVPEFQQWCTANSCYLFPFSWDWRRRLDETARFFVRVFLPEFRYRVMSAGLQDPLVNFSLVGHSFGGMVVNLILRGNDPIVAGMANAITVATPFYGYAGQTHRWFEGEPLLNLFGVLTSSIIRTISSMPALYTLMFLEEALYDDSTNNPLLGSGPHPVNQYPSMDQADASVRADAYNPTTDGSQTRYPSNMGFDLAELDYARLQIQQLTAPMAPNLLQKFYNIRGLRAANDTAGALRWDWIDPNFDPWWDSSPIQDGAMVAGDDTQPAWTARLLTNAAARCIDVQDAGIEHAYMMNHALVIQEIGKILCAAPVPIAPAQQHVTAGKNTRRDFLRWLAKHRRRRTWPRFRRDAPPPRALPKRLKRRLPSIMRGIYKELVRGPVRRTKAKPQRPPRKRKPGGRRRPVRRSRKR
jgi:hypothetical protein